MSEQLPKAKKQRMFSSTRSERAVKFNAISYYHNTPEHAPTQSHLHSSESTTTNHNHQTLTAPESNLSSSPFAFTPPSDVKIRKAHQCHESGELQHFDDDIEFYMESLDGKNSTGKRCLSILGLAKKAMSPEFRMHLRAHDDMPRIISVLKDAPDDASLALSCATLMFIYNQDRMTFDIDPQALELMLKLLETRSDQGDCLIEKRHRDQVRELCDQMKQKGHAKFLKLDEITAGKLAMETLLGLTSKRAGDWVKEELRRLKGLDFILDTVINTLDIEDAARNESQLNEIERCMHVLENVSCHFTQVY